MVQLLPTAWKIILKIWFESAESTTRSCYKSPKWSGMLCKKNTTTNQPFFFLQDMSSSNKHLNHTKVCIQLVCTWHYYWTECLWLHTIKAFNFKWDLVAWLQNCCFGVILHGFCFNKHFLRSFLFSLDLVIRIATAAWGSVVLHLATVSGAHCTKACAVGCLRIVAHTPDRQNVELQCGHGSSAPLQISRFRI